MRRSALMACCFAIACSSTSRPPIVDGTTTAPTDGGSEDASGDAGPTSTRPAGTWCALHQHAVCEDFDDPSAPLMLVPGTAVQSTNVVSAPNALASTTMALAAAESAKAQLQLSSATPPADKTHVDATFAFDVRVDTGNATSVEILRVAGVNPIDFRDYGFGILISNGAASIQLQSGTKPLVRAPAQKTWEHVVIKLGMNVAVNGPPTTITIQVGDGAPESFSDTGGMGVRPFLRLGANLGGPAPACEIDFDDVTFDID